MNGWMTCDFASFSNSISVVPGRWEVDNEMVCAMELRLRLRRFRLERGPNSVRLISRPSGYRGSFLRKSDQIYAEIGKFGKLPSVNLHVFVHSVENNI